VWVGGCGVEGGGRRVWVWGWGCGWGGGGVWVGGCVGVNVCRKERAVRWGEVVSERKVAERG